MKNPEQIIEKLISEHEFLKSMQDTIVKNYDIILQNQRQNTDNYGQVIQNQTTIIKNQEIIVNNQMNIVRNQKNIVQNQITLQVILHTQAYILNLVKELSGNKEPIAETLSQIEGLGTELKEIVSKKPLNEMTGI